MLYGPCVAIVVVGCALAPLEILQRFGRTIGETWLRLLLCSRRSVCVCVCVLADETGVIIERANGLYTAPQRNEIRKFGGVDALSLKLPAVGCLLLCGELLNPLQTD